ncbi:MAG: glycine hydroxymethyltransferase, partial [Deltaproteobacteria bacterium]
DKVLAMKLSHGGHLSHGDAASITSWCFEFRHYGVSPKTELIDYDAVEQMALDFRPRMIVAGASSYPRVIDYERFAAIARKVGAFLLVDMAHIAGLVAAGVIPSPVPHSDFVTFTTYKTLMGGRGGVILCRKEFAKKIDQSVFPGCQGTPALNMVAAKAVCFGRALKPDFARLQGQIVKNAVAMARQLAGHGYRIVTGGTDNHLVLFDVGSKGLTGDVAEDVLESVGIIVNRNVIPREGENPLHPSGIRVGATTMTARAMLEGEATLIADLIDMVLMNHDRPDVLTRAREEVSRLCRRFPATIGQ